jgi:hypothetical protein
MDNSVSLVNLVRGRDWPLRQMPPECTWATQSYKDNIFQFKILLYSLNQENVKRMLLEIYKRRCEENIKMDFTKTDY